MSATTVVAPAPSSQPAKPVQDIPSKGLTSDEARARLEKDGPNAMPDTSAHPLRNALAKFWAPVPWLLEASIVLELVLHKYYEAAVIAALLIFNAALAYFQESSCSGHPCGSEIPPGTQRLSPARWRLEDCAGLGIGMWRPGEAVSWWCGRCRRTSDRWISLNSISRCSQANLCLLKQVRVWTPMPGLSSGVEKLRP